MDGNASQACNSAPCASGSARPSGANSAAGANGPNAATTPRPSFPPPYTCVKITGPANGLQEVETIPCPKPPPAPTAQVAPAAPAAPAEAAPHPTQIPPGAAAVGVIPPAPAPTINLGAATCPPAAAYPVAVNVEIIDAAGCTITDPDGNILSSK